MAVRKTHAIDYGFNAHDTIRHLHTADLIIHTIPGEEWTLSMYRHETLLVDVYVLSGTVTGTKKVQCWECGRLCELLLKLLRCGRNVQCISHGEKDITLLHSTRRMCAETLEDDALLRLRGGDMVFCLIPGEEWRLTGTGFGRLPLAGTMLFRLAEIQTFDTSKRRMFNSTVLEHVLLEFLCQQSEFVERKASKVIEFRGGNKS